MRYRLLALDIDGTLLRSDGTVSARVDDALGRLARSGVKVLLCTGRRFRTAREVLDGLQWAELVACSSGALVKRLSDGATVRRCVISPDLVRRAVRIVRRHGGRPLVIVDGGEEGPDFWYDDRGEESEGWRAYVSRNAAAYGKLVDDLSQTPPPEPLELCVPGTADLLEPAAEALRSELGDEVHVSLVMNMKYPGCMLEINARHGTKYHALEYVAKACGVGMDEVASAGDDNNDLEMVRLSGLGAAMANATPALLAAADVVVPSNDEDGVAELIDRFLLPAESTG